MILFDRMVISDMKLMFPERSAMFLQNICQGGPKFAYSTLTAHLNTHSTYIWIKETHNFELFGSDQ